MQSESGAVDLATPHSGRLIVMDFVRHGMHGAQPRFAVMDDNLPRGRRGGILYSAAELIKKHQDQLLSHPDACLIAAAPDLLKALQNVCNEASAMLALNEPAIREAAGNTNFTVLLTRVIEGFTAISNATK
jgi:hypothetical protein